MSTELNVNDFGCVPDGRFLERASIGADSAILTDLDGTLRVTDAGKNIAIPGAVDLVATIAKLIDRWEVKDAVMDATGNEPRLLRGTLINPEDGKKAAFQERVHTGLRITVAGAGPGGSTLVSDVEKVINSTTIELADAASTSVSNVEVILNRPNRITLSNYARRTVSNLTVELGDRSINDAAMMVGARGLDSETAKFSSLDLGKEVTIRAAGLFVTTIQFFNTSTQVTLAAPAQRETEAVQADVWKTDSRPGLELLLAALEGLQVESTEIRFGSGVYDFTRTPNGDNKMNAAIELRNLRNLTLRGSGAGATILRLMPHQDLSRPDTHVVETRDCTNLTFRDLSIHGAYLTMAAVNEQMHGIQLNEGSEEIVVERVRVFQSAGDGIRFLGSRTNRVRKVWVDGCRFIQNKRTGLGFQRGVEFVWVRNCYIEMTPPSTDSCVDFEPTGKVDTDDVGPNHIIIDSNFMVHGTNGPAVSLSGIAGQDPLIRAKFSNNMVIGGDIFCTDVDQLTIQNNVVLVPNLGTRQRIPIQVQRGGDSIIITGNLLVNDDTATRAVIVLSEVNQRQVTHALIANNLCFARSGRGIECRSCDDVAIQANMIIATEACNQGIFLDSQSSNLDNISVRDNDIMAEGSGTWITGIQINSTDDHQVHHVSVVGNSVRAATEGIKFQGKTFQQTPVCALNRIDPGVTSPLVGLGNLPEDSLVVGGATNRGGAGANSGAGRLIVGMGNPNNKVTGNVGDIFQRIDIPPSDEEAPSNLYVKTSGNGANTGWVAK